MGDNRMSHDLYNEMSKNFIEYAAACNTDRAIPDATSGLKPVALRILYDAYENGHTFSKAHVKSAKIVGEVMGTYHPHGDSSIYGAMIRLGQDWIMRYPLIDIHGNKGSIDGDGPAASRYTEARLSKIAEDGLLNGLKKNCVDFRPNYDETTVEPITLPAVFPNLLCNPNSGIGVALACNWLPHNLTEVGQAILDYLDGKEPTLPGPDFPTGGVIINKNDIPAIMKTGHGSVKVRGRYQIEKNNIVFTELPYGVATEDLLKELGEVIDTEKKIEGVAHVRNESNKKGIRVVIECDKNANAENIVQKLFMYTDLQTSVSYNQVALVNKVPTELNLLKCIQIYVKHNIECIIKAAKFDLAKAQDRQEIVEGLLKALVDIDKIIAFIKKSASSAAAALGLQNEFGFTERQAKAIVGMKLGSLAGLERIELEKEAEELANKIKELNALLSSEELQENKVKENLKNIVAKYGDKRRTFLEQIEVPKEEKEIAAVVPEDCVVIMSQSGNIKRVPTSAFKIQKRNGKGIKSEDDAILDMISTNTVDTLMLFSNKGKMYRILVDNVPTGTNISKGSPVNGLITLDTNEKIIAMTSLYRKSKAKYVIFITKQGLFKKTAIEEYMGGKKTTGIAAIKLKEGDSIANVTFAEEEDFIVITKCGMSIHFETKDIAAIGRATSGVKAIKLADNDEVLVGLPIKHLTDTLAVFSENGLAKKTSLDEYPVQGRGGKGLAVLKDGVVVGAALVSDDDLILLCGKPNSICISAKDIPQLGRISVGNQMINGSKIRSVVKV